MGNRYPPWSMGGYEVVWAESVEALRARGHPVRVLTTVADPSEHPSAAAAPQDTHRDLRWYWRAHAFPSLGVREVMALERENAAVLSRHIDAHRPDVVVWWAMGGMSLALVERVRRAGLPAVGVVGDEWMVYGPHVDAWTARWRRWPGPLATAAGALSGIPARPDLDRAARWLFNSRHLLGRARAAGWRLPAAEIVPPGIDPERLGFRAPSDWRWRLLYCGRLDPRKGVTTAIGALARLPREATLVVHGDGSAEYREELRDLASRLGVADRVTFTRGDHASVAAVYAAADAVLFPVTWEEPWGLVPLEAMSVGRPVIASRAGGGPAEYLVDEANCLLFAPGDAASLGAHVRRLAADPGLREALVHEGRLTAARFSEKNFLDGLERALAAAVAGPAQARPQSAEARP